MGWMANIMFAVLFTGMAGTVLTAMWKVFSICWMKSGNIKFPYSLLKMVMVVWLLPIVYVLLQVLDRSRKSWGGNLFWGTPALQSVSLGFFAAWILGCIAFLIYDGVCRIRLAKLRRTAIPCSMDTERVFRTSMEGMKGVSRVRLAQSYDVSVPCVAGVVRPLILLPVREYAAEDLQKIFSHELTHVRHGDLIMKNLAVYIRAVHFMNPLAWWVMNQYEELSECVCDYEICRTVQELKAYYHFVLEQAQTLAHHRSLMIGICGDKNCLMRRMKIVIRCRVNKKSSVVVAVAAAIVMLFCSVTSVYAASVKSADALSHITDETEATAETEGEELEEFIETEDDPNVAVYDGEVSSAARSTVKTFSWTLVPSSYTRTSGIYLKKGKKISLNVVNESGTSFRAGIVCPDASKIYVKGTDSVSKTFTITTAGTYRVYVQNLSSTSTISVVGSYIVY